jgi:hypothetical protein
MECKVFRVNKETEQLSYMQQQDDRLRIVTPMVVRTAIRRSITWKVEIVKGLATKKRAIVFG